ATPTAIPDAEDAALATTDEAAPTDEAGTTDDFRRIQGVGPKMAAALQAAGIRTYRQLAELDETALRETIRAAGLRGAPSLATWPQQAKVLAGTGAESVLPAPTGVGEQN
ncbi:helix-hairpin-helix domain-containing protein, partial [Micromonospora sp. KC723]|uniref:helix-hairpin-helix domain-containing protein n=1 Tax=Micromonospora sp. KC723 TaxID=2530381 RepID=UPI001FB5CB7A